MAIDQTTGVNTTTSIPRQPLTDIQKKNLTTISEKLNQPVSLVSGQFNEPTAPAPSVPAPVTQPQQPQVIQPETQPQQSALTGALNDSIATQKTVAEATAKNLEEAQRLAEENKKLSETQATSQVQREQEFAKLKIDSEKANLEAQKGYEQQLQNEMSRRAAEQQETMKPMLDAESDAQKALLAKQMSDNDKALADAKIVNDVAIQKAALNINRMGLAFSTAGVNTALQIHTQGANELARLTTNATYQEANTKLNIEKIKVDHANVLNKIISDSTTEALKSKSRVANLITSTNNNILLTEKQKADNIDKIVDKYRKDKMDIEDSMYTKMRVANDDIVKASQAIAQTVKLAQDNSRTDLDTMMKTGVIAKLSPAQVLDLEQKAGLPPGSVGYMLKDSIIKGITTSIEAIAGTSVGFGMEKIQPNIIGNMTSEITQLNKLGYPLSMATQAVMNKYLPKLPGYQEAIDLKSSSSKQSKALADIQLKQAQTLLTEKKTITETERAKTQFENTKIANAKANSQAALIQSQITKNLRVPKGKGGGPGSSSAGAPSIIMRDGILYNQSAKGALTKFTGATAVGEVTNSIGQVIGFKLADGSQINKGGNILAPAVTQSVTQISGGTRETTTGKGEAWKTGFSSTPVVKSAFDQFLESQ